MLCNLMASSGDPDTDAEWKEDYSVGFGQEVYCLPLSKGFIGWEFCEVATELYLSFGICPFGLSIPGQAVMINASHYIIMGTESGVVIADCIEEAQLMSDHMPTSGRPAHPSSQLQDFPIVCPDPFLGERPQPTMGRGGAKEFDSFQSHWIVCGN